MGHMEYSRNNQVFSGYDAEGRKKSELDDILPKENLKKIVVYVYGKDNIDYVNALSINERNHLINEILETGRVKSFYQIKRDAIRNFALQVFIIVLSIVVAVPIIYFVSNNVYHYTQKVTKDNYNDYGQKFEKLYQDKNFQSNPKFKKKGYGY